MKRILLCAALAVTFLLGGCAASPVYRGLDTSTGSFVSTYSPVVSVTAAEGYENVMAGHVLTRVPYETGFMNLVSADVDFSLFKKDGSQLVAVFAECPNDEIWEVRALGVDFQHLKVLYESNGMAPNDATVHVYVRPASMDPWTVLFAREGKAEWQGDTLVARYEWIGGTQTGKLIVEYREPAPELLSGMMPGLDVLTSFIERSQKAFTIGGVPEVPAPAQRRNVTISDKLLAPVLGSVSIHNNFKIF